MRHIAWQTICLLVNIVSLGCGGSAVDKVEVQGSVLYEGKRVLNGDIRYQPIEGTSGRATQAPIIDGEYSILQKGGVPVGKHQVKIRAFILEGLGPIGGGSNAGDMMGGSGRQKKGIPNRIYVSEGRENYLPNQYNDRTELVRIVSPDSNPQRIDFELKAGD